MPKSKPERVNMLVTYQRHTKKLTTETGLRLLARAVDRLADDHQIDWDDIGEIHITGPSLLNTKAHRNDWIIVIDSKDAKGFPVRPAT